jgi:nitrite reductase/ring-hydroxylating ferredoxin subunit
MTAWVTVANVEDLPQGETLGVTVDATDVLVVNLGDRYVAMVRSVAHAPQRRQRARP